MWLGRGGSCSRARVESHGPSRRCRDGLAEDGEEDDMKTTSSVQPRLSTALVANFPREGYLLYCEPVLPA